VDQEKGVAVSITPEFGEEGVMQEAEEERVREESRSGPPVWEGELHSGLTKDRIYLDAESNEAHVEGKVCERCGAAIAANQDARRLPDGQWVHEVCPPHPSA
jgi:hypothetical protein